MYPAKNGQRATTNLDVAHHAGVSRAAVSKVLRNAYGVSPAMKQRVEAAIAELDYHPSVAARTMRGASFTIGIEMPAVDNPFLSEVVDGAAEALETTGYQLIIAPTRVDTQSPQALQALHDRQVDGIIAIAPLAQAEWLEQLAGRVSLVMLGRHDEDAPYDAVVCNDDMGTSLALEHLYDLGHRRIAHLTRSEEVTDLTTRSPHAVRLRQYLKFMEDKGLGAHAQILRTNSRELEARSVVLDALKSAGGRPTAIFAGNDELALGALHAVHELKLKPSDVSVVGYDDIEMASHPALSLTTIDQHGKAMGFAAAKMLLERIAGRSVPRKYVSQPVLRVRESSARPARSQD